MELRRIIDFIYYYFMVGSLPCWRKVTIPRPGFPPRPFSGPLL